MSSLWPSVGLERKEEIRTKCRMRYSTQNEEKKAISINQHTLDTQFCRHHRDSFLVLSGSCSPSHFFFLILESIERVIER